MAGSLLSGLREATFLMHSSPALISALLWGGTQSQVFA